MAYGKELILDLYGCDVLSFSRQGISDWLDNVCEAIDMKQADLHFWDYTGVPESEIPYDQPHLVGTSAVQFITTSDIVIHTLDMVGECYINLFSCKTFDENVVIELTKKWFSADKVISTVLVRGSETKTKLNEEQF